MVDDYRENHANNLSTMFPEIDLVFIEFMLQENQINIPNTLESLLRFQKFIKKRDKLKTLDAGSEDASPPPYNFEVDDIKPLTNTCSQLLAGDSEVEPFKTIQNERFSENHEFLRKRYINYKNRQGEKHINGVFSSSTSKNSTSQISTSKNSTSKNSFSVEATRHIYSDGSSSSLIKVPLPLPRIPAKNQASSKNNGKRNRQTRTTARHSKMLPVPSGNNSPKSPKKTVLHDRSEWQTFDE